MQRLITFVLAAAPGAKKREVSELKSLQSAPHYFASSVPRQFLVEREGDFIIKSYPPNILLVEVTREVKDVFSDECFTLRDRLIDECYAILQKRKGDAELREEYAIAVVDHYKGDPEQFLTHAAKMACFLKSEKLALDEQEIAHTLETQLKYAKDDLIVVDWDGAFVFESTGDVDAIVELLQIANLQLLQYRMLDRDTDRRLKSVEEHMRKGTKVKWLRNRELERAFREVIQVRAKSIGEFDALDRDIKLIGDWYYARLYELIGRKFRLGEWRRSIKEKLDSLEDFYGIVSENFSVSRLHFLEMIQIILFFVLQVGWFVLIIVELKFFLR